jgi:catalase
VGRRTAAATPTPYPDADPTLGESLYPDEAALAERIGAVIEAGLRRRYGSGPVLRDAHPKAHGTVFAEFRVAATLPAGLAHGVFVPGAKYPAWIRFSNGNPDAGRADDQGDARGMAIKLHGLAGTSLLADDERFAGGATQDFILISHPVFFANDPARYLAMLDDATSDSALAKLKVPIDLGVHGSLIAFATAMKRIANPVQTRYWSTVPYQLGSGAQRQAVKYSVRPLGDDADPLPDDADDDFLRDELQSTLRAGSVDLEFLVQPRTSETMSVEDSMTEWSEDDAPLHRVATIHIPKQKFATAEHDAFGESLSFNPWHALPEHRPLGVTNRLRKVVYERISRVRRETAK